MPKGNTQTPCDWWIAAVKSAVVSSSQWGESFD
jgi:hypothetical protein